MAPKKKAPQKPKQNAPDSFPGLKGPEEPAAKTRYQELQETEVMVLQAIYGDDFKQHSAAHSAWQVRPQRASHLNSEFVVRNSYLTDVVLLLEI